MVSKKGFVIEQYSILILSDETKYQTFRALCLEQFSLAVEQTVCSRPHHRIGKLLYDVPS